MKHQFDLNKCNVWCPECKRWLTPTQFPIIPTHTLANGEVCSGSEIRAAYIASVKAENITISIETSDE